MAIDPTPKDPERNAKDLQQSQSSRNRSGVDWCQETELLQRNPHESALRDRAEELAALNALGRSVNATLSVEEVSVAALKGMLKAVRCDLAFLFLRDNERLILKDVMPSKARQRLGVIPDHRVGECLCGLTVRGGRALFSRDLFADHRCTWEECKGAGLRSLATLPLSSGAEIIGVIGLASESERDFEQQAEFLETMAGQVSVALKNARLFEVAQRELAERKQAEEALRRSERRYRSFINVTTQFAWVTDPTGLVVEDIPALRAFTGQTYEQARDVGWADALHPDDKKRTLEVWTRAVSTKTPYEVEYRMRRHDGAYRLLLARGVPILDDQGSVIEWVGTCIDITERELAQDDLRQALAKAEAGDRMLAALMEHVPEGITIVDAELNVKRISRQGQELIGQHEGKTTQEVAAALAVSLPDGETPMPFEDLPLVRAVRRGETVEDIELVQVNARGEKLPLLCNAAPIRDADGHVVGGIVAWRDITERKRAQERAQKDQQEALLANRILRAFVEYEGDEMFDQVLAAIQEGMSSRYGIFGYIPKPGHLTCPSLSKMFDACEVEGKCIHYPPERWKGLWARALTEKRSFYINKAPYVPAEHPIIHNNLAVPVLFHGEAIGLLNLANKEGGYSDEDQRILEGIAARLAPVLYAWIQRKLREDERKQAEEQIKASLVEKEVLLKEIHHRVKNNMQVISSLVSLQADGMQDEAMRAALQDVTHRVRSMALVHEKLYQSANLARVDFAEYARSLLNYLWRAHGTAASGIRLALDLEPVSLSVDTAVPCGLILNELTTNALKHAFRGGMGGEVAVSLRSALDGNVRLCVRDNGKGLPDGFDWKQARTLGLRLVQMLAGQLHAAVEVTTLEGTEFTITFEISKT